MTQGKEKKKEKEIFIWLIICGRDSDLVCVFLEKQLKWDTVLLEKEVFSYIEEFEIFHREM